MPLEAVHFIAMEWSSYSHVSADIEPSDCVYHICGELVDEAKESRRADAGRFGLYYMDVALARSYGLSPWDLFDNSSITREYYPAIYTSDSEEYSPRLTELLGHEPVAENVLILDRLELLPKYRSKGIGLAVMRRMIERFGSGAGLVALKSFPLQFEEHYEEGQAGEWRSLLKLSAFDSGIATASRKLASHYSRLGFVKLQGSALMFRPYGLFLSP